MLSQVVVGLRDMHAVGLVHRDMKLENIFVTEGRHLKIGLSFFFSIRCSF
jgi:serine/threonine protein kinase